jgi:glycosyltransferase involved in cell wall biosynthesis
MSESASGDFERVRWKEAVKRFIVKKFSAALVGGTRHAEYLERLGMEREKIFFGYDVVDNAHFEAESDKARSNADHLRSVKDLPENYFLIVSRFVAKKNLAFVINSFHEYLRRTTGSACHLLIVGDGPEKEHLAKLVDKLDLREKVHFEGFKQYNELPVYFGLARGLIHASTSEQWGLVVNEALACGIPVLVSKNCGCVPELVVDGQNGFSFDPYDQTKLTELMLLIEKDLHSTMGVKGREFVSKLSPDAFGKGLAGAAELAIKSPVKSLLLSQKLLFKLALNR